MANLIASFENVGQFVNTLNSLKAQGKEITTEEYFLPLANYCVTQNNMEFGNGSGETTEATLLILESQKKSGKCYTLAYATGVGGYMGDMLKAYLSEYSYLASGTGSVGADGNTTNISLTLTPTGATKNLCFDNQNIVKITDSSGNDEIRINTQGVAKNAELDFSKGEADTDTIKFNGATTVQKISGGGVRREYTYSSA